MGTSTAEKYFSMGLDKEGFDVPLSLCNNEQKLLLLSLSIS